MDMEDIRVWARQHRRLSAGAIRRRFMVSRDEADRLILLLLGARILHPKPEGESYRVRYPKLEPPTDWHDSRPRPYIYQER